MKAFKILSATALTLLLVGSATLTTAQENMIPLMREMPQRAAFNPALRHSTKGYFNAIFMLAGGSFGVSNSGFRYADMFSRSADDSLHFDLDKLSSEMRDINLTTFDMRVPFFELGLPLRHGDGYLTVGAGFKGRLDVTFGKNLVDFRKGNYDYDADVIRECRIEDLFVRGEIYQELSGGYSRMIGERLRLGARIKLLAGIMSVSADNMTLEVSTERDSEGRSSIVMRNTGHLHVTAPLDITEDEEGFVESMSLRENRHLSDYNVFRNRGMAFDVGGELTLGDSIKIGLAVTDMGYIRWRNNPHQFDVKNSHRFYGVDVSDEVRAVQKGEGLDSDDNTYWKNLRDSVEAMAHMRTDTSSFKTSMSARLLLTGEFPIRSWLTLGATFSGEFVNRRYYTHTSMAAVLRAPKVVSGIVSLSLNPGVRPALGAGIVLTGGPFQFHLLAERIPLRLSTATGAHVSTGVNFLLGRD